MARTLGGSRLEVLAAAALFSTGGAAIKLTALGGWQVASLRAGIAALVLLLLLPAARRGWSLGAVAVGIPYAGATICYALANKLTTAANTIFLQATSPLYLLVLAPWLLRERLRRIDLLFMLVLAGGLGMFFVGTEPARETAPDPFAGNLLAAGAGLSWAFAVIGLRALSRAGATGGGAMPAVVSGNLIAFLVCLPAALPLTGAGAADWAVVAYLGVIQIGLAYVFLTTALRQLPALEVTLLLLIEPVLNPIWAWWLHGESPGPWRLAGGCLILGATAAKTLYEFVASRSAASVAAGAGFRGSSSGGQ